MRRAVLQCEERCTSTQVQHCDHQHEEHFDGKGRNRHEERNCGKDGGDKHYSIERLEKYDNKNEAYESGKGLHMYAAQHVGADDGVHEEQNRGAQGAKYH